MRKLVRVSAIPTILTLLAMPALAASQPTAFETIATHYEAVRQELLHDSTNGVATHAKAIAAEAATLRERFDAAQASVPAARSSECTTLLPAIEAAAKALAASTDLKTARTAFGELSKPMVRYRDMASGDRPEVVYCSMARKSWLQPAGEIGNPYLGQEMARCGEVVSR